MLVAATHWTDPTVVSTLVLAGGTFFLGIFAVVTAHHTKRSVKNAESLVTETKALVDETRTLGDTSAHQVTATKDNVEIARKDLETAIRPVLADVPRDQFFRQTDPRIPERLKDLAEIEVVPKSKQAGSTCLVPMRNVGTGVAVLDEVLANVPPDQTSHRGEPSVLIVPPGEVVLLSFDLPVSPAETFAVSARYTDIAQGQPTRTVLFVQRVDAIGRWQVGSIGLFEGDEPSTFGGFPPRVWRSPREDAATENRPA